MAERSWFFNAEQTGEDEYDRVYLAEDFAKYFSLFISNGVFPNPSTGLQVLAQTVPNMTVTLKPGFAFINGYGYENTSDYVFTIDTADGVLNREDSIFIRWYLTDRKIAAYKAVGTPGAEASHVDLIRTEDYWDLCVARITVKAGVTSITQSAITDTRLNTDLCGIVATLVDQVDTTTLYNQIQADLEEFQNVSEEDFTAWYQQQQQMFTTWYQQQQQMFNTWYQEQQSDFDEWFDDINSKLGTEPATALQQQIDEINTSIEESSDRGFSTYRHVKSGTEHMFIGSGSNGKVKMTADIASGDKVVISSAPKQKVTVEGATSQPGSGDPSPDNIRMIDGVGMYDQCVVLDGSDDESWTVSAKGGSGPNPYYAQFSFPSGYPALPFDANTEGNHTASSHIPGAATGAYVYLGNTGICCFTASGNTRLNLSFRGIPSNVTELKSYLSAHPLIIWYRSVDFYKCKGPFYYVHEVSDGTESPYKAIGVELNAPLFDGDSLEIGGLSGFDQMILFDGSDDETWGINATQNGVTNFVIHYFALGLGPSASADKGSAYSDRLKRSTRLFADASTAKENKTFLINNLDIFYRSTQFADVAGLKRDLQSHPLIIFYKSVNYTPEADIAVALESCKSSYKIFDGTEEFTLAYSGEEANEYDLVLSGAGTILDTSSDDNARCSHFKKGYTTVDGNWRAFYMTSNVTIQFFRSKTECPDVDSFKQWLQEEYENGTPVQCVMNYATAVTYAHLAQTESLPTYYGTEDFVTALAGEPVTGKWLTFTNDGTQLNFKGGGALSKAKLDLATAEADDVRQGLTFYAKGKELRTGVVPSFDYNVDAKGTEHYQNKLRILFDPGFYGKYGQSVPDPGVTFDAGDAGVGDVLEGKTFSSNGPGAKAAGQMPERGKWNGTYSGSDVVIPEGHHSGSGSVSVAGGNRGAWSGTYSGSNVTIPQGYHSGGGSVSVAGGNRGNWGTTINQGGSVTIPQGYHSGGGVVRANSVTPGCERAGACWANGMANGSGWQGSAYCSGGNNMYDAWVDAAVSGYFCVWTMGAGGGQAPANYWFGWANAGQQLGSRGSNDTGCMMVTYIHI